MAVGGRATLFGAVVGALLVNFAKTYFTGAFPEVWLFALGGLFILVTILAPQGIIGLFKRGKKKGPDEPGSEIESDSEVKAS